MSLFCIYTYITYKLDVSKCVYMVLLKISHPIQYRLADDFFFFSCREDVHSKIFLSKSH